MMWGWDRVAEQYASLISGKEVSPLSPSPFALEPPVAATAQWNGTAVALFNGDTWNFRFFPPRLAFTMGVYALYVDNDIQVRSHVLAS